MPTDSKGEVFGRVLVTGAGGFLGRTVAEALERAGHIVLRGARALPASAPSGQAWIRHGEPWIRHGELGAETRWGTVLDDVQTVVHLAGLAHLSEATGAADALTRVNVEGTARLASAAVAAGTRRVVLVSSALVHGAVSRGRPFSEEDTPAPASPYAHSKLD
jgi:nucleoside-diphosphate-sugar epimerase